MYSVFPVLILGAFFLFFLTVTAECGAAASPVTEDTLITLVYRTGLTFPHN